MAILIEGKFRDLFQFSDCLYVRIAELSINRNLGIIEVKLDFFMNPDSASEYKLKSIKSLTSPLEIKVDEEHLPVNLQHLQFFENGTWIATNLQNKHTLLAFSKDTVSFEIPTFDLVDETEQHIDFDDEGNQIIINKKSKKPIKRVHNTKERMIYKIDQQAVNQPYKWTYSQIYQLIAETFNNYQIKNI